MKQTTINIIGALLLLGVFSMISTGAAEEYRKISWVDLTVKFEFEDPFVELSAKQLSDLSQVARLREIEQQPDSTLSAEDQARMERLEEQLASQGVEVDELLARRWEVAELRQKRYELVNEALDNTKIEIGGYLLPLNLVSDKVTEFLLVPWVGACIHTPPPPQNQLIYVESKEGIGLPSRFQPVQVEGVLSTGTKTSTLFLVDGSNDIVSGYTMLNATIKAL